VIVLVATDVHNGSRLGKSNQTEELGSGVELAGIASSFPGWECGRDLSAAASRGSRGITPYAHHVIAAYGMQQAITVLRH
jgi:hypothetical protein